MFGEILYNSFTRFVATFHKMIPCKFSWVWWENFLGDANYFFGGCTPENPSMRCSSIFLPEFILYFSPEVAFEVVNYCCEHTKKLQQSTNIFSKYFPNIFKVLAWFPRTFLREFMELLPAMISEKTYMEVSPHSSVFCSVNPDETRMRVHESWQVLVSCS